jgi:pimeloyl-ACP methyl ester carboxylesterase
VSNLQSLPGGQQLRVEPLATGAEARLTNADASRVVVCVNGGQANEVPGTWSASLEWLVVRLASRFRELGFVEVRYRIKSWRRLDLCVEDARAAVREHGRERTLLLGFSMGGAVAIASADEERVERVLGLAPWIPPRLDVAPLDGKRLDVLHGSLDRWLPGIPGVSARSSRAGYDRVRARGVDGTYMLIPCALHGVAVRAVGGRLVSLPRARAWAKAIAAQLEEFAS